MMYYEFKIAYENNENLIPQFSRSQQTLFQLQKLFDDNFKAVFLGNSYSYTLWYNNLLNKFKQVFSLNMSETERLLMVIDIYKNLYFKCAKMHTRNNKNNKLNQFSIFDTRKTA